MSPQTISSRNNKGKNKTAICDIYCQINTADILSGSNKIQEMIKRVKMELIEKYTAAMIKFKNLNVVFNT